MKFSDFDKEADALKRGGEELKAKIVNLQQEQETVSRQLDKLLHEINVLAKQLDLKEFKFEENVTINDLNEYLERIFPNNGLKTDTDRQFDMQIADYIVAALAGGVAVIVDALLVKIPKNMIVVRDGNRIVQEGSSLTGIFRSVGIDENGNASKWVETLEEWFKVNYDKSIDPNVIGLNPSSHRLHSLAHDPSLTGLMFAIIDTVRGTFTCLDRNGCLVVENVTEKDFLKLLVMPIMWLGHLLSDAFTKLGIPIPGWCYLQVLQFGSFGEKERTISEVARYMYLEGYDLRHYLSMSTVNATIELIIRLYYILVCKQRSKDHSLKAEKEYLELRNKIKLHDMLFVSYVIASCGNISKICAYKGNPSALNLPLWFGMIREALAKAEILTRNSKYYEESIENRHVIDENFNMLCSMLWSDK